jgi:hypothetical protein
MKPWEILQVTSSSRLEASPGQKEVIELYAPEVFKGFGDVTS